MMTTYRFDSDFGFSCLTRWLSIERVGFGEFLVNEVHRLTQKGA